MRAGLWRAATPAAIVSVLAAGPAVAAAAPTLAPGQACYVNNGASLAQLSITGGGWTAGDTVEVSSTPDAFDQSLVADANGNLSGTLGTTVLDTYGPAVEQFSLTGTDQGNFNTGTTPSPAPTATTTVMVANAAAATKPTVAPPSETVKWSFSGVPAGTVYGHFLHGRKVVATVRFGKSAGQCSVWSVRARMYPRHARTYQHYTVQIDNAKKYSAKTPGAIREPFKII